MQQDHACGGCHGVLDATDKQNSAGGGEPEQQHDGAREVPSHLSAKIELPAAQVSSADGQICRGEAAADPGSAGKAQRSEHSVEQLDPKTPSWAQREAADPSKYANLETCWENIHKSYVRAIRPHPL